MWVHLLRVYHYHCNEFLVHHSIYGRSTYDMARIARCATNIRRRLRLGLDPAGSALFG